MIIRPKYLAGIALLCIGVGATGYELLEEPAEVQPSVEATRAASEPEVRAPRSPETNVAAIPGELEGLRSDVAALKRRAAEESARAEATPEALETIPRTDATRAEAELARQEYMASVESAFLDENDDPSWALETTTLLREALTTQAGVLAGARNIECRSSTCRVEIPDDGTGQLSKVLPVFAQRVGEALPNISADRVEDEDGGSAMVLYLSRRD